MRKAFTLIELLVVISIISLLVSMILPSFHKVRNYSKRIMCMTNLKAIGTGFNMYEKDHPDWLPLATHQKTDEEEVLVVDVMAPYVGAETWRCPSDDQGLFENPDRRTSYEYLGGYLHVLLMGIATEEEWNQARTMMVDFAEQIPILWDAEVFHPTSHMPEARNYLYWDNHMEFTDQLELPEVPSP